MLQVSLVQAPLVWEDIRANLDHFSRLFATHLTETDLVVLPEMFSTGFSMQAQALAEQLPGPTLQWMREWADRLDAVVTGSIIVEEAGQYLNRLLWVEPGGRYRYYDKHHLFSPAGEANAYAAGTERVVFTWRGWRIRPFICYDLRFPLWSQNQAPYYDLALYIASWPATRAHHWRTLLQARAIENQAYVAGVNRVGEDGTGYHYSGDSSLIDYAGNVIAHCADQAWITTHILDMDGLRSYREKLPFLADAD